MVLEHLASTWDKRRKFSRIKKNRKFFHKYRTYQLKIDYFPFSQTLWLLIIGTTPI